MLRTRVGYAGGDKDKPTYRSMGDHTEVISIDFDPNRIGYEDLLSHFWRAHRCQNAGKSRQYMNAIFYHDAEQKVAAELSLREQVKRMGVSMESVTTKVVPVKSFTYAEEYHQKYGLNREARDFLEGVYPTTKAFADSAVGARLASYFGSGLERDWDEFLSELPSYGLPEKMEIRLRNQAEERRR